MRRHCTFLLDSKIFVNRERNLYSRELTADRVITLADETHNALNLFAQDLETFGKKIGGIMPESPPSGPSLL